jgi:hypothetical protein
MEAPTDAIFQKNYQRHLQHLKLKGLQPKTIDAYSRAVRRIGARFDGCIDNLSELASWSCLTRSRWSGGPAISRFEGVGGEF